MAFKTVVAVGAHLQMQIWGCAAFSVFEALLFFFIPLLLYGLHILGAQDKYRSQGSSKCILANNEKLLRAPAFLLLFILYLREQQNLT